MRQSVIASAIVLLALLLGIGAAEASCTAPVGTIVSLQGHVELRRGGATEWQAASDNTPLCPGDTLRVGDRSRAEAALFNQPKVRIDQNSTLRVVEQVPEHRSLIDLVSGAAYFFSRRPRSLDVRTPLVSAAVEGTEFLVQAAADRTLLTVIEGRIVATSDAGRLAIGSGQSAIVAPAQPPVPYAVRQPWDGLAWALFYPPILSAPLDPAATAAPGQADPLQQAIALAGQRRMPEAFARLDAVPASARSLAFYTTRAALLLSVGRSEQAQADLEQALATDPASGTAYALRAMIALAQNDPAAAALADRGVDLAPAAAAPRIARSYVWQRRGELEPARKDLRQAVSAEPGNALAWSRLAELSLAVGRPSASRDASAAARAISPQSAAVLTVDGFSALVEFDARAARQAFEAAIAVDPGYPLARFGLGLAMIRGGDLEAGREQIELAVALDPGNALYRAFLGKAYFEERRPKLAGAQFDLAKQLAPDDPTAYFFAALLQQSENRPVAALRDIEDSIARNDNRLPFRSPELLNSDRAARGTSLARIYSDLGMQQLAVDEAARSLSLDPASASAHRFLADTYATQRRNEIGRVSEQVQAQLFQDININPVPPSLSVTGLDIDSGGPFRIGLNEYTPLFERNRAQLNLAGQAGNNNTWANEAVVSGVYDWFSISGGQFFSTSDGFRQNADITNKVYNLFTQAALSPQVNVQAQVIARDTDSGDRTMNFDPDDYLPNLRLKNEEKLFRVGARLSPSPATHVVSSFVYSLLDVDSEFESETDFEPLDNNDEGIQFENQLVHKFSSANTVAGVKIYNVNSESRNDKNNIAGAGIYSYNNINFSTDFMLLLGMALDRYSSDTQDDKLLGINPKLGLQWEIVDDVTVKAAVFRTLKTDIVVRGTIEPTQVASFDQFYDDFNGTQAWNYAAGIHVWPDQSVNSGAETVIRRLDVPLAGERDWDWHEAHYRGYVNWIVSDELVVGTELLFERFDSGGEPAAPILSFNAIEHVDTITVPLGFRYFSPIGMFGGGSLDLVNQHVRGIRTFGDGRGFSKRSRFVTPNAFIGYRLPGRRGAIVLQGTNLANKGFDFQDDNFQTPADGSGRVLSQFIPERRILLSVSLNF